MTESNQSPNDEIRGVDSWLRSWTLRAARRPIPVLLAGVVMLVLFWALASRLRLKGDFVELLPTESQAAQRFRAALSRKGGGESTLIVLVESPKPELNERIVRDLEDRLRKFPSSLITHVEAGPRELTEFYRKWRWLYLDVKDIERIECVLSKEQARLSPAHLDLDDPCEEPQAAAGSSAKPAQADGQGGKLGQLRREVEDRIREIDKFPDGFYRTPDRRVYSVVIRAPRAGMGEFSADQLLDRVKATSNELAAQAHEPALHIGFGGDIPNAVAEREALMADIGIVSVVGVLLIFTVVSVFFRSMMALLHVGFCTAIGTGFAFAVASFAFGRLNAATSFLGSLIMGNGINYGIIYLARYRERRSAGDALGEALADAAVTCRRSTWLASLAAGGAYASLMITSFRGFSEFGLIGGVGMLACWLSTFVTLPACVAWVEGRRSQAKSPSPSPSAQSGRAASRVSEFIAACGTRYPRLLLAGAVVLTVFASLQVRTYLRDPWEYNFRKLRSEASAKQGAGHWSGLADKVFRSRGSPQLVLANDASEVQAVAARILERDRQLTGGKFVERVETIVDMLGGPQKIVAEKLELLEEIRDRIDAMKHRLTGEDRQFADDWRPPESLRPLTAEDLPWAIKQRYSERDGRVGTPVYVTLSRTVSQSRGENLLAISNILEGATGADGKALPNASRAAVFSEMISSMKRDGPRATLLAFLIVVAVSVLVARSIRGIICVLGALLLGVLYMVGVAAWFDIRLNFLNFVALPLTFGIGVEYAINMYERIRVENGDVASAARSVAGAIALCSLTAMLGYSALMFADNQALQSFGQYAILGEFACFAAALLIMPAVLILWAARRRTALAVP